MLVEFLNESIPYFLTFYQNTKVLFSKILTEFYLFLPSCNWKKRQPDSVNGCILFINVGLADRQNFTYLNPHILLIIILNYSTNQAKPIFLLN